jgi:glycosyltransferase involved in cell wall biosynthesis
MQSLLTKIERQWRTCISSTEQCRNKLLFKTRSIFEKVQSPTTGPLVSVIIPTFNRFDSLQRAVNSVLNQHWQSLEILVVNDCSPDHRYNSLNNHGKVRYVHLESNSRELFGYPSAGHVRSQGIQRAKGEFIAFLDDDDEWLPWKLTRQMRILTKQGTNACCTEGLFGEAPFNSEICYPLYNANVYKTELRTRLSDYHVLQHGHLPSKFSIDLFNAHNCAITSSVIIRREILDLAGGMRSLPNGEEDWDCWKRVAQLGPFSYENFPCVFYDCLHGGGKHY